MAVTPMTLEDGHYYQDAFQDFAHFIKAKIGVGFLVQQIHVVYFHIFIQLSVTIFETNNFLLG